MKKGEKKTPEIVFNPFDKLSPKEKEDARALVTSPLYIKLLSMVQQFRPSSVCKLGGSTERDAFSNERAAIRLGEMRGFDLYQQAIFSLLTDRPKPPSIDQATYPESGRVDAKFGEISPEQK